MMKRPKANDMFSRYRRGIATDEEKRIIERWWLYYRIGEGIELSKEKENRISLDLERKINAALDGIDGKNKRRRVRAYLSAASIVLFIAIGALWQINRIESTSNVSDHYLQNQVVPGTNKAVLIVDDGRSVDLSENQSGIVIGEHITYSDGSEIGDFKGILSAPSKRALQFTLSTPKGGQYQVTLPDGTQVWLNAASTLRYPSRFLEDARVVELDGEAYFDVRHADKMPFIVKTNNHQISVLGTEFNVMNYPDEPVSKTTLISGSLKVYGPSQLEVVGEAQNAVVLKPGQQAFSGSGEVTFDVRDVDVDLEASWKSGYFMFENESIKSIMRKATRWYDHLEVEFVGSPPTRSFYGGIPRDASLSDFLQVLKLNDINFLQEDNKIVIRPE